jgi:hypothetical protein
MAVFARPLHVGLGFGHGLGGRVVDGGPCPAGGAEAGFTPVERDGVEGFPVAVSARVIPLLNLVLKGSRREHLGLGLEWTEEGGFWLKAEALTMSIEVISSAAQSMEIVARESVLVSWRDAEE